MRAAFVLAAFCVLATAQAASLLGTLVDIKPDTLELIVQPEAAGQGTRTFMLTPETVIQRVAPGQRDLKNAEALAATALAKGDRVLVTTVADTVKLRRLVVMSASDIARRHDEEREDWNRRGVMGTLVSRAAGDVLVKLRDGSQATITVAAGTRVRRYPPDSVKFADAIPSTLEEMKSGDQVRARGDRNGGRIQADELVFGSFVTRAGEVASVDTTSGLLVLTDSATRKTTTVRVRPDAQVKRFPDIAAMMASGGGPPAGMPMPGAMGGGAPPDPAQMIERLPSSRLEEIRPGETILVSSTVSAQEGEATAITILGNATFFLRMLAMQAGGGGGPAGMRPPGGMPPGGMGMGGGPGMMLDLPGMLP